MSIGDADRQSLDTAADIGDVITGQIKALLEEAQEKAEEIERRAREKASVIVQEAQSRAGAIEREGHERGERAARDVVEQARTQANQILDDSRAEAADARRRAAEQGARVAERARARLLKHVDATEGEFEALIAGLRRDVESLERG